MIQAQGAIAANERAGRSLRGFSLFELIVVISLFSVLVFVFLQRLGDTQEYAEKTAMEMMVMNIRTGLRYKLSDLMFNNQYSEMQKLLDENPVNWLDNPPDNYAGEFVGSSVEGITPGNWYFDRQGKELIYRLNRHEHFSGAGRFPEIRYRVSGKIQEQNANGVKWKVISDIKLAPVGSVAWFEK